ncbi:DUF1624 domain-containing protein [Niastella populi]|uniref:Heparan-alpha-glucosaminide N-acetyltransferase catalytic domain-containing protein n=1 Tax=Niastella populi TaxID=550983 RepID=A0A1V9FJE2_9BACT|nr:heparan-alpha-glucosaminide N-acetyltransferase domain-containing protein [Niastella populi]OQP58336.1 hypothetical protein A4R26_02400 [Niastella populi]
MKRIYSIDLMRGIVMIIMALDHVRDLLHTTSLTDQPTNLATTTPALFFTRWVTHLCAPTFVFLSGVSAFVSMKNRNDMYATRRFLLIRGVWLMALEFTLVNFGLLFDVRFKILIFEVIAAIGLGFIVLAFLINRSPKTIGIIGLAIMFLHNLAPLVPGSESSVFKKVLMPFFAPGVIPLGGDRSCFMAYPPLPWLAIMLIGFATARFFTLEIQKQRSVFLKLALASFTMFIILRAINIYGDPVPWSQQKNGVYTFLSFINLTKYPPSLQFCLLFPGIMFLILSAVQGIKGKITDVISVYGKVPLFYFLVHFYIIHSLVFVMVFLQGFSPSDLEFGFNFGRPKSGSGLALWAIYLVWTGIVVVMYPLCKWYARYKEAHKEKKWLRYL